VLHAVWPVPLLLPSRRAHRAAVRRPGASAGGGGGVSAAAAGPGGEGSATHAGRGRDPRRRGRGPVRDLRPRPDRAEPTGIGVPPLPPLRGGPVVPALPTTARPGVSGV